MILSEADFKKFHGTFCEKMFSLLWNLSKLCNKIVFIWNWYEMENRTESIVEIQLPVDINGSSNYIDNSFGPSPESNLNPATSVRNAQNVFGPISFTRMRLLSNLFLPKERPEKVREPKETEKRTKIYTSFWWNQGWNFQPKLKMLPKRTSMCKEPSVPSLFRWWRSLQFRTKSFSHNLSFIFYFNFSPLRCSPSSTAQRLWKVFQ